MLFDFPARIPDLRPEEARDAKQTAEVVRCVLDWLDKFRRHLQRLRIDLRLFVAYVKTKHAGAREHGDSLNVVEKLYG